jgi:hypothetical protein
LSSLVVVEAVARAVVVVRVVTEQTTPHLHRPQHQKFLVAVVL